MIVPKNILRNLFNFFPFGQESYLDDVLRYSPKLRDFYDNIDLILKLALANDVHRNQFLENDSCNRLVLPTVIDSIRYQNSFDDLCTSCKILEDVLECNSIYVALWILGVLKVRRHSRGWGSPWLHFDRVWARTDTPDPGSYQI